MAIGFEMATRQLKEFNFIRCVSLFPFHRYQFIIVSIFEFLMHEITEI